MNLKDKITLCLWIIVPSLIFLLLFWGITGMVQLVKRYGMYQYNLGQATGVARTIQYVQNNLDCIHQRSQGTMMRVQ